MPSRARHHERLRTAGAAKVSRTAGGRVVRASEQGAYTCAMAVRTSKTHLILYTSSATDPAGSRPPGQQPPSMLPATLPYSAPPRPSVNAPVGQSWQRAWSCGGWRALDPAPARQDWPATSDKPLEPAVARRRQREAIALTAAIAAPVAGGRRAARTCHHHHNDHTSSTSRCSPAYWHAWHAHTRGHCRPRHPSALLWPDQSWPGLTLIMADCHCVCAKKRSS